MLQSMGLQRVRHDIVTEQQVYRYLHLLLHQGLVENKGPEYEIRQFVWISQKSQMLKPKLTFKKCWQRCIFCRMSNKPTKTASTRLTKMIHSGDLNWVFSQKERWDRPRRAENISIHRLFDLFPSTAKVGSTPLTLLWSSVTAYFRPQWLSSAKIRLDTETAWKWLHLL